MLYITVILCLAALVFLPYEMVMLSRIFAVMKIKRLCRKNDVEFKIINKFYPFSKNSNNKFDILLYIGRTTMPIKFFSSLYTTDTIIFDRWGKICTVRQYREPLSRDGRKKLKTVRTVKKMPSMRLNKKLIRTSGYCFPVLLNVPSSKKVFICDEKGNLSSFYDGAFKIEGCTFMEMSTLADLISMYDEKAAYQQKTVK